jgi:hypothetical protein
MTLNPSSPAPSSPFDDVSLAASPDALAGEFTVGVDLGQSFDPTAVAVVRKLHGASDAPIFQIGHLERLPLQTPYPGVVNHVGHLIQRLRGPSELVIDYTGVGRPVFDMFQIAGLTPIGVSIVAGDALTSEPPIYRVPKLMLISRVQALLHGGRLKIHKGLAEAAALVSEMQSFQASVSDHGYWRFGARSGKHDDLVLAVAIALWRAHGDTCFPGWGVFEYMRQTYGPAAVDREPTAMPAPLAPIEPLEGPNFGHTFAPPAIPQASLVTLRAPAAVSSASGLSGRAYTPDRNGCFHMTAEDAKPLIDGAGWRRVEVEAATERWRPS